MEITLDDQLVSTHSEEYQFTPQWSKQVYVSLDCGSFNGSFDELDNTLVDSGESDDEGDSMRTLFDEIPSRKEEALFRFFRQHSSENDSPLSEEQNDNDPNHHSVAVELLTTLKDDLNTVTKNRDGILTSEIEFKNANKLLKTKDAIHIREIKRLQINEDFYKREVDRLKCELEPLDILRKQKNKYRAEFQSLKGDLEKTQAELRKSRALRWEHYSRMKSREDEVVDLRVRLEKVEPLRLKYENAQTDARFAELEDTINGLHRQIFDESTRRIIAEEKLEKGLENCELKSMREKAKDVATIKVLERVIRGLENDLSVSGTEIKMLKRKVDSLEHVALLLTTGEMEYDISSSALGAMGNNEARPSNLETFKQTLHQERFQEGISYAVEKETRSAFSRMKEEWETKALGLEYASLNGENELNDEDEDGGLIDLDEEGSLKLKEFQRVEPLPTNLVFHKDGTVEFRRWYDPEESG